MSGWIIGLGCVITPDLALAGQGVSLGGSLPTPEPVAYTLFAVSLAVVLGWRSRGR